MVDTFCGQATQLRYQHFAKAACGSPPDRSSTVRSVNAPLRKERGAFSQRKTPGSLDFSTFPGDLILIEATRFELAASASRTRRSTKLSHASICICYCEPIARSRCYLTSYLQKRQVPFYGFTVFTVFPYVGQTCSSLPAVGLCSA